MDPEALVKNLPVVDKALSLALKKATAPPLVRRELQMQPCLAGKIAARQESPRKKQIEKVSKDQINFTS